MEVKYSDCYYCEGSVEERLISRELRWRHRLFVFENVPIGVCSQCGENVVRPKVAKNIDRILEENKKPTKMLQVPVYEYE